MLILIHGENTYLAFQKLQELRKNAGNRVSTFESANFDFPQFLEKATATSLFNEEELIVLKGLLSEKKKENSEKILKFLVKEQNDSNLVFWEEKTIKTGKLFKFLQEKGQTFHFPKFNRRELKKWITQEFQNENYTLEIGVVDLMADWLGEDLWLVSSEIEKLKLYKDEVKKITTKDVATLSSIQTKGNIFELVDGLGYRNKKRTLSLLMQILKSGESPFLVWAMVVRQYRLLLQVKDLLERGKTQAEIVKELKLIPFVAGKILSQARQYQIPELQEIFIALLEIDTGMKLGDDPALSLERLIERVCRS